MAIRFWVAGGTGNWNSTTNWSTSSGGASGASVPGAADGPILNANSGAGPVTLDISPNVSTLDCTGFTGTLAFGTNTISLNGTGSLFIGNATMTVTGTPLIILTDTSATARLVSAQAASEANSISFKTIGGTGTWSVAGAVRDLDFTNGTNPTGYAGAMASNSFTVYGSFKASTGMTRTAGVQGITFASTSGTKTINTAGVTFDCPFAFTGVGGTWQLQAALTSGSTRTVTLTNGTLDLAGYTMTVGAFSSTNSNTRVLAFGTGKIVLTGSAATIFTTAAATGLTVTGTPLVQATTAATTGTRGITMGNAGEANAISFDITAGSDIIAFGTTSGAFKNVNFTGFTGTFVFNNSLNFFGNFDSGGITSMTGTGAAQFLATSGTQTIDTNGLPFPVTLVFGNSGTTATTFQLASNTGCGTVLTLSGGTLNFGSYTLTCLSFTASSATTRTLAFGTGKLVITGGSGTMFNTDTGTNLTVTGSKRVEYTYSGSVGTRAISGPTTATIVVGVNICDHYVTAGSDIFNPNGARGYGTVNFTGFTGSTGAAVARIYGSLVLGAGMTTIASATTIYSFLAPDAQTITSNGVVINAPIAFTNATGTWTCQDALSVTDSVTLASGTLKLKSGVTSTVGSFVTTGTTMKYLQSSTAGTRAALSDDSGTNTVSYLSIKDIDAIGGSVWNAASLTNSNLGNNTNWIFSANNFFLLFA